MDRTLLRQASWIWLEHAYVDPVHRYGLFRRAVDLERAPGVAPAWVTADQSYQLFVNGRYVARGPARGYQAHWPVDELDLAPYLEAGSNTLAAVVYSPGVSTFQYVSALSAGFLFAADLAETRLVSDGAWRCRSDPARLRHTPKLSQQMGFQEHVDLRHAEHGWMTSPTDRLGDAWKAPAVVAPFGSAPWHDVEPRGLPMLTSHVMPYAKCVGQAQLTATAPRAGEPIRPTRVHFASLAEADWRSAPTSELCQERLRFALPACEAGQAAAVTIDLGRASVGELLLGVQGAAGRETLDVLFAEAAEPSGRPVLADPAAHPLDMATRLTLAADSCSHQAFQVIGHRYATLVATGPCPVLQIAIGHRETRYDLAMQGGFETDNAGLQRIYEVSVNTQRNCMLDAYVDTPWREQAQWWGDARVQAWNTFYLADDTRLLRRGLRQIGDPAQAVPNGLTYGHAPTIAHSCILPDFTCVWMLTVWDDYFQSGSTQMFEELWPRIDQALRYFEAYGVADGGLVEADPRYWLFLDWTEGLPRTGKPALLNLLLLEALQRLGELVEASGHVGPLTRVGDLKTALRRSIEDRLWDGDQQRYRDGINASGRHFDTCSLHAQVQAVLCGLRPRWHKHVARGVLSPFLAGTSRETAEPTPYWLTYVYEAARRLGLGRQVVTHLAERWVPMADSGGTWERFEPPGTGETSGSHAWSAHPIHHLPRLLAGVVNTEPGWSRIRFEPVLDWAGADRCKAEVPTPHGQVRAAWEREPSSDANTRVELALPAGVTADVHLPRREAEHLSGPGDWTWRVVP